MGMVVKEMISDLFFGCARVSAFERELKNGDFSVKVAAERTPYEVQTSHEGKRFYEGILKKSIYVTRSGYSLSVMHIPGRPSPDVVFKLGGRSINVGTLQSKRLIRIVSNLKQSLEST